MLNLKSKLYSNIYNSYMYSYPHKTSYEFHDPIKLDSIWKNESKENLFLYFHIPFCTHKCGYCNLFSLCKFDDETIEKYLDKLKEQSSTIIKAIQPKSISNVAIGGGTPTILNPNTLDKLFKIAYKSFNISNIPISIEVSPDTITKEKILILKNYDVTRISIGIQSFVYDELNYLHRFNNIDCINNALNIISQASFEVFNIDLIYGIPNQTTESLIYSLKQSLQFNPTEIYLYPLYVRPLTTLSSSNNDSNNKIKLYNTAKEFLISQGMTQKSMRKFSFNTFEKDSEYSCQEDGMIGIGAGSRSYTSNYHYSFEYGVSQKKVSSIMDNYLKNNSFDFSNYGVFLNKNEQKIRYLIKSILHFKGLDINTYNNKFNSNVLDDFSLIWDLININLAVLKDNIIFLTEEGLMLSDSIGPLFTSDDIKSKQERFKLS